MEPVEFLAVSMVFLLDSPLTKDLWLTSADCVHLLHSAHTFFLSAISFRNFLDIQYHSLLEVSFKLFLLHSTSGTIVAFVPSTVLVPPEAFAPTRASD